MGFKIINFDAFVRLTMFVWPAAMAQLEFVGSAFGHKTRWTRHPDRTSTKVVLGGLSTLQSPLSETPKLRKQRDIFDRTVVCFLGPSSAICLNGSGLCLSSSKLDPGSIVNTVACSATSNLARQRRFATYRNRKEIGQMYTNVYFWYWFLLVKFHH